MKISLDTETEELEELRHTIAIIEDAIKRRENPDFYEEPKPESEEPTTPTETEIPKQPSFEEPPQEPELEPEPTPEVDMSSLTTSNYGEQQENRTMEPPSPEPEPIPNIKEIIKEIILSIRNLNPGQPIQMQEIITKAQEKNISEDDTRNLVSELQKEGSI